MNNTHARRLRAAHRGYHPDDEVFYGRPLLRRLLPYALDQAATAPPTVADTGELHRHHAGKGDGHGGWEASIADVRKALETLPPLERRLLTLTFRGGLTAGWLAAKLGRGRDEIIDRVKGAVTQIQQFLGGPRE